MRRAIERRLAAIVSADVAGFSRLMEADETRTLATLKAHRAATDPVIEEYAGRTVGTAGDSLLIEFPSAADAVSAALAMQAAITERNAGVAAENRMLFRVGINLGDVMVENDDIFGNGENVAARLQELAEPGGIWISHSVHDQVRYSLDLDYEDQGKHRVKNISEPIHSYRLITNAQERERLGAARGKTTGRRRWIIGGTVILCLIGAGVAAWIIFGMMQSGTSSSACTDHLGLPVPCPTGKGF